MSFATNLEFNIKEARLKSYPYRSFKKGKGLGSEIPSGQEVDPESIVRHVVVLDKAIAKGGRIAQQATRLKDEMLAIQTSKNKLAALEAKENLKARQDSTYKEIREFIPGFYDTVDEVKTRGVQLGDIILEMQASNLNPKVDWTAVWAGILELAKDNRSKLEKLKELHTTYSQRTPAVSIKKNEDITDLPKQAWTGIKNFGGNILSSIRNSFSSWDKKYDNLLSVINSSMRLPS